MQIDTEVLLPGSERIDVCNILDYSFDGVLGFTPGDVRRICADFGRPEKFEEAERWYGCHRFGNAEVYNPWSIAMYIDSGFVPGSYWVDTSGNAVVSRILNRIDETAAEMLSGILAGEDVRSDIIPAVSHTDLDGADATGLFSVLAVGGYLNAVPAEDGEGYHLSIPNGELRKMFRGFIHQHVRGMNERRYIGFVDSALKSDVDMMRSVLEDATYRI